MNISPFLKVALKLAVDRGASDVYLSSGAPIVVKIEGDHHPVGGPKDILTPEIMDQVAASLLTEEQKAHFKKNLEIDIPVQITATRTLPAISSPSRIRSSFITTTKNRSSTSARSGMTRTRT